MIRKIILFIFIFKSIISCKSSEIELPKINNYNEIYSYYSEKKYSEALNLIKHIESYDSDLLSLAGNICLKLNNLTESEVYFKKAYDQKKNEKNGLNYANLLILKNDYLKALLIIEELYNQNKEEPLYSYLIGVISKELTDYEKALEFFTYSINKGFEPVNEIYFNIIDIYSLSINESLFNKYLFLFKKSNEFVKGLEDDNRTDLLKIETLIKKRKFVEAIDLVRILLEKDQNNEKLNLIYGDLNFLKNDFENSHKIYDSILYRNPNSLESYIGVINSLFKLKKYDSAIQYVNKSKKIFPNNSEIYYKSCLLHEALYDYKYAISECKRSITLNPIRINEKIITLGDLCILSNDPYDALKFYSKLNGKINKYLLEDRLKLTYSLIELQESKKFLNSGNIDKAIFHAKQSIDKAENLRSEFNYAKIIFLFDNKKEGYNLLNKIFIKYKYYPALILINERSNLSESNLSDRPNLLDEPSDRKSLLEVGDYYEGEGDYLIALEYYKKIKSYEEDKLIDAKIANCYYNISLYKYKNNLFEIALEFISIAKKYNNISEYSLFEKKIKYKINLSINNIDYNRALELEKIGKLENAIKIYIKLFEKSSSLEIADKIIKLYLKLSNKQEIFNFIEDYKIISLPEGKEFLAQFYYQIGFISESKNICNDLLNQSTNSLIALLTLGMISLDTDPTESLRYFQLALDIDPDSLQAKIGIGNSYFKLNNFEKAKLFYNSSINNEGNLNLAVYNLFSIYLIEKDIKKMKSLLEIFKRNNKNIDYLFMKANYDFLIENYNSSLSIISDLIKIKPSLEYYELLLKISIKKKESKSIIQDIKLNIDKLKISENIIFKSKVYNIYIHEIRENIIQIPIKINMNYILNTGKSIISMNSNLSKINWKLNGNFSFIYTYLNNFILVQSENELILIDSNSGIIKWKFLFEYLKPRLFIRNNIYCIFESKKNNLSYLLKIDESGKLIFQKEIKKSYLYYIDFSEYLYSIKLNQSSFEWIVENLNNDQIIKNGTLFTPNNDLINILTESNNYIIFSKGNFIYKIFNDGKFQIKKLPYQNINIISKDIYMIKNIYTNSCELDELDLSCKEINIEKNKNNQIILHDRIIFIEGDQLKVINRDDKKSSKELPLNNLLDHSILKLYIPN